MELRALWKIALRRWWLIALPALVALAYAAYGYLKAPPGGGFSTGIRFTAAQPPDGCRRGYEDCRYYPWLESEYVVNALTDWVKTASFAEAVSEELAASHNLQIAPSQLQGGVMISDNARSVMTLTINWPDATQLAAIAEAATTVLRTRSGEFFPQLGQNDLDVVALDTPAIGPVPPSLTARLNPLVRFGLGLAAGVALAFLVEYLDPALHDRAGVESLGLAVLAEIPPHRR